RHGEDGVTDRLEEDTAGGVAERGAPRLGIERVHEGDLDAQIGKTVAEQVRGAAVSLFEATKWCAPGPAAATRVSSETATAAWPEPRARAPAPPSRSFTRRSSTALV